MLFAQSPPFAILKPKNFKIGKAELGNFLREVVVGPAGFKWPGPGPRGTWRRGSAKLFVSDFRTGMTAHANIYFAPLVIYARLKIWVG